MPNSASPNSPRAEMKRHLTMMIVSVVVLDAIVIGVYYAFHIAQREVKVQQTFVAVWVVLTLVVVTTLLKRVREARRRGR
ncbi:MAG TPA: hypothetical protein VHB25_17760 [Gemmatimonadaceae bacterium]|nr:hypothetical protein [Gemmatimonadaceae bacterium]